MRLKTIAAPLDYSDRQGDKLDPATVTQTAWPVARKGVGGVNGLVQMEMKGKV